MKPTWYYNCSRHEIIDFLPKSVTRLLDIGCGTGYFGKSVKEKLQCETHGIEYEEDVAAKAKKNIDMVYTGDCIKILPSLNEHFDCVTMLDALEHIQDHEMALRSIHNMIDKNCTLVISIPNILFIRVLADLLIHKDFRYQDSGILDKTHVRFFTKKSISRLLDDVGFKIERIEGINPTLYKRLFNILNVLTLGHFSESRYQQLVIVAKKK